MTSWHGQPKAPPNPHRPSTVDDDVELALQLAEYQACGKLPLQLLDAADCYALVERYFDAKLNRIEVDMDQPARKPHEIDRRYYFRAGVATQQSKIAELEQQIADLNQFIEDIGKDVTCFENLYDIEKRTSAAWEAEYRATLRRLEQIQSDDVHIELNQCRAANEVLREQVRILRNVLMSDRDGFEKLAAHRSGPPGPLTHQVCSSKLAVINDVLDDNFPSTT